jgi:septal ring-binding cell division protein DamX
MVLSRALCLVLLWCFAGLTYAQSVRDAEWLLRQNPNAFTLQLVTVSNAAGLAEVTENHQNPKGFARFRVQGQNQLLYVLTYGVYEQAAQAEGARAEVARAVGLAPEQLWVRRLASVQRAIRTTLQQ